MKPAEEPYVLGDFDDAEFEHDGTSYLFHRDGNAFRVEQEGADGENTSYEIEYAVGITPLQQYLVETKPGRLQALDIAWDTENRRWFHLFPDQKLTPEDGLHWTGPYKNWNARCAECHQTDFRKNYEPRTRSYSSTWSELNVTCEACHGAGEAHVAWAHAQESGADPSAAISGFAGIDNYGFLTGLEGSNQFRELNLCFRCHSRREPIGADSPPAASLFSNDYRLSLLRPGLYYPDGQIRDEVYVAGSFLQSKMYAAGVTCTNCHDPHSLKLKAEGNALCTQCHNPQGNPDFSGLKPALYDDPGHHHHEARSDGARCTSCHMPETTYMRVDPRRDHSFRVPRPDLSVEFGVPNACTGCHTGKTDEWAAETVKGWYPDGRSGTPSLAHFLDPGMTLDDVAVERLAVYAETVENAGIARASVLERLSQAETPEVGIRVAPLLDDKDPLVRSAAADLQAGAEPEYILERLLPLLTDPVKSVRIDAARYMISVLSRPIPDDKRQALSEAFREYQSSLAAKADFPETQMAIGGLALALRNVPVADQAFRTAAELDPQLHEAWRMRARIAWATGDPEGAISIAEEGLKKRPDSALLMSTLAEIFGSTGRQEEARRFLERAQEAARQNEDP
ncbi:tetratricopeptide repeat protein [Stappia sediminis]|uniref:tetratricopeptide repeat protein n=1 Tax=Stappia sediminis TaxID=2692190 RepID=UPI00136DB12B|nr:cytochrome c3 family protein [Stappia sediminis]